MKFSLLIILLTVKWLKSIEAVEKLSSCSARLDDGRIIDLKALDNPGSPR